MTQEAALDILKTGVNVFLTGEPGSGKTHAINRYVRYLREHAIEPAITASTGIAATHIGGMTIHSWSGIGIKSKLTKFDIDVISQKERVAARVADARVLIIDEISMLSAETLDSVDRVCRALRRSSEPFGGLQVVLVGDFFQLPPVSRLHTAQTPASALFAFHAAAWQEANLLVCYLTEQYRHEDGAFLKALTSLRRREVSESVRGCLSARRVEIPAGSAVTKLFPHNVDVDRINEEQLGKLKGEPRVFIMHGRGSAHLVESLKRSCLSPETLRLKPKAKVIFTKNSPEGRFVNGTTGFVTGFSKISGHPVVQTRGGRKIEAAPMEWTVEDHARVLAKIIQVPLRLAWAITVHKSQGMSLDAAVIDLREAFEYGQGYVALSRVRTLAGLYLLGFNERALEVHPEVSAQDAAFRTQSDQAVQAIKISPQELAESHRDFIKACGGTMAPRRQEKQTAGRLRERRFERTLALIREGRSVADVAEERGRTEGTIIQHLEKLRAVRRLPVAEITHLIADKAEVVAEIHRAFAALGAERLKPIYDNFAGRHSYETIRLARLFFEQLS